MNRIVIDGVTIEIPRAVEAQGKAALDAWEADVRAGTPPDEAAAKVLPKPDAPVEDDAPAE